MWADKGHLTEFQALEKNFASKSIILGTFCHLQQHFPNCCPCERQNVKNLRAKLKLFKNINVASEDIICVHIYVKKII